MAQGFKRTGNAFSTKKSSAGSASSSSSSGSNKIRKGARFIAPKKTAAKAKVNLTHKLTAQLNRRAESALITRLGGNREGTLKVVRPDSQIVEELMAKKAKKDAGRNSSAASASSKKESENDSESMNSLSKSALQHLNEQENFESSEEEAEENDEE